MDIDDQKNQKIEWTPKMEDHLKTIMKKSEQHKIMHLKESIQNSSIYNWLMYIGITLGPLTGLLINIDQVNESDYFSIISSGLSFCSGLVVAVTKFGNFEEMSSQHKIASSKYTSLENNIKRQLTLPQPSRVNAIQYLDYINNKFDEIFLNSPLIKKRTYQDFIDQQKINIENDKKEKNIHKKNIYNTYICNSDKEMQYELDRMNQII
jgi:hypothetical protein